MDIKWTVLALTLLTVAGCTGAAPYVDRPYEINRDDAMFPDGPPVTDGVSGTVCYAKSGTTPREIRALADAECARGGNLKAQFTSQSLSPCPLLTPIAAHFSCVGAVAGSRTVSGTTGSGAQAGAPQPMFEAPRPAGLGRSFGSIDAGDVSTTAKSQPYPTYLFNDGQRNR
ncbi:MAG: hypothetical protein JJ855_15665 [Rhodospirillales bacterium]|nr:hypothetical protein [Rhodospirillales bacterium]